MTDSLVTDHAFRPSKRGDSCDFTYWQRIGPWLVCDQPAAAHDFDLVADLARLPLAADLNKPKRIPSSDAAYKPGRFVS